MNTTSTKTTYFSSSKITTVQIVMNFIADRSPVGCIFSITSRTLFSEYTNMSGLDPEPNASGNDGSFSAVASYLGRQKVVGTNTPNTRNFIFGVNFTF